MRLRARQALAAFLGGIALLATSGCGTNSSISTGTGTTTTPTPSPTPVNNTLPVSVNAGPNNNNVNELLASVTICVHGTSNCQTISNVLVDTGSTGLRLLASAVSLSLPMATASAGGELGNCVTFAGNTYAWGPVATADIQLAGETASSVPIQIINASGFPAAPEDCSQGGSNTDESSLGATGILGVGLFPQDCGSACTVSTGPAVYFSCPSSGCVPTTASLQQQVQNPIALFAQDNNGLIISLPALDPGGDPSASGSLVFGIGTQSDNALSAVQVYTTDANGNFSVTFNGQTYSNSFVDSGSNGFFLLNANTLGVPTCSVNTTFYCPASTINYTAVTQGTNGVSSTIAFSLANANALFNTGYTAFNDIGGPNVAGIDLGLPFFFGRPVYLAIQSASTSGGTGPYWAF